MALSTANYRVLSPLPYRRPLSTSSTAPIRSQTLNFPNYDRLSSYASFPTCSSRSFLSGSCKTMLGKPFQSVGMVKHHRGSDNELEPSAADDEDHVFDFGDLNLDPLIPILELHAQEAFKEVSLICLSGLIRFWVLTVIDLLLMVSRDTKVMELVYLDKHVRKCLADNSHNFSQNDVVEIKRILKNHTTINKDSYHYDPLREAVKQFLMERCNWDPSLGKLLEIFDTSSIYGDINCIALAYILKMLAGKVIFPAMDDVINALTNGKQRKLLPVNWFGKHLAEYAARLRHGRIETFEIIVKRESLLNRKVAILRTVSATADAASKSFPWKNLKDIAKKMKSFGLRGMHHNQEVDPDDDDHEYWDKLSGSIIRFNNILIDFDQEMMQDVYSRLGTIDLAKSKMALERANTELHELRRILMADLECQRRFGTNSTFFTSMGMGLFYSFFAYRYAVEGIRKIREVNDGKSSSVTGKFGDSAALLICGMKQLFDKLINKVKGKTGNSEESCKYYPFLSPQTSHSLPSTFPTKTTSANPSPPSSFPGNEEEDIDPGQEVIF